MRNIFTAFALCAIALSASAQGALGAHAQVAAGDQPSGLIKTANAATVPAELGHGPLMNVSARGTGALQRVDAVVQRKQDPAQEPEHRRRAGPAMMLAALAVMSAIALRRLSAPHL